MTDIVTPLEEGIVEVVLESLVKHSHVDELTRGIGEQQAFPVFF